MYRILILASTLVAACGAPLVAAEPEGALSVPRLKLELSAPVDVAALEREFDATGSIVIPVRGEMLTLDLRERDLFGPRGREVYEVSDDGTAVLVGYVTARPLAGVVRGVHPSQATVTIDTGSKSVFGTIRMNDRAYSLVGEPDADGRTILKTVWNERIRPTPQSAAEEGPSPMTAGKNTYIRVFSDTNFRNYAGSDGWKTRVTAAFNEQHSMWDGQTDIHQYHGPFTSITGAWSANCSTHLASFSSHVQSGINGGTYVGDDAYQLFTGVDLSGCYGMAYAAGPGSTLTLGTSSAVSILEAVDHGCCDTYDPDESDDLGLVSGQELGHNYGEEDHPQEERCETYFLGACVNESYNIMASGTDHDEREFWFTDGSSSDSEERILAEAWPQL